MPKPTNSNLLAGNAFAVANSAEILFLKTDDYIRLNEMPLAGTTFIGGTILCSFAIELLLKSIHSLLSPDTIFPSGHNIEKLFDTIHDNNLKNVLIDRFNEKTGKTLQDFLSKHRHAFANWRYFAESNCDISFDAIDARILIEILKSEINNIKNIQAMQI
jgi:hypothetical protein